MPKTSLFRFKTEETKTEPAKAKTESKPKADSEPKHLAPEPSPQRGSENEVQRLAAAMSRAFEGMSTKIEKLDAKLKELGEKPQVAPIDMEAVAKAAREANQEVLKEASDAAKAATEAAQAAVKAAEGAQQASIDEIASLRRQLDALTRQLAMTPAEAKEKSEDVAKLHELRIRAKGRKVALEERAEDAAALDALAD